MIRLRSSLGASALVLACLSACAKPLNDRPIGHAQPVTDWHGVSIMFRDGDVYFAGQPSAPALRDASERGFKLVVNLRSRQEINREGELNERSLVEELGMGYVWIPVTPASLSVADADQLKDMLGNTPGPVLIHCASSNRAGALWALYLYRYRDFSLEDSIERGRKAGLRSDALIEVVRRIAKRQS